MNEISFSEWLYEQERKSDNILAPGLDDRLAIKFLIKYLLGNDWYIDYSANQNQVNTHAIDAILTKFSKKYKIEKKKLRKDIKNGRRFTKTI